MRERLILKNISFLVGAQVFNLIGRQLVFFLLARYLGVVGFGKLSLALGNTDLFSIMADFGLGIIVTREVAADKERAARYIANTMVLKVALASISAMLIVLFINISPYPRDIRLLVYIFIPTIFFNAMSGPFVYIFRAYEDMRQESKISMATNFFYVSLGLSAIYFKADIFLFAIITTICSLVGLSLAAAIYQAKYRVFERKLDTTLVRGLLKAAFPVGIGIILFMAANRIDVILLSLLKGIKDVGLYAASYRLISVLLFLPYVLATSIFPAISQWSKQGKTQDMRRLAQGLLKAVMIIAIPAAMFVSLHSSRIIELIYGESFLKSADALRIAVWYLAISFPAFIFTHILLLSRAKQFTYFNLIGLVASVIFNLLLIPPLGIAGVAVSAVINISVLTLLCYRQVRVDLFRLDFKEILLLPLLASAAMVVLAFFSGGQTLLELSVYSALLYCALLYLIRGVNQADLQYLITIIKSRGVQDAR